jgi:DNA helicase II / ATP-dependent DNA helicase PcrA
MQDYLGGLNEPQREAVLHVDGPIMIVAGAGSGKTKVLTTRIAHLMAKGVDAFNILALTFTNKAAAEMKERVEKILGNSEARNLYIGTLHEFCVPRLPSWVIPTTSPFMIRTMPRAWSRR